MLRLAAILILSLSAAGCMHPRVQAEAPLFASGYGPDSAEHDPAIAPAVFSSQEEGLAAVVRELDAVAELVEIVSRLPQAPGELTVSFARIHADIAAVRGGLIEAIRKPATAPRIWNPLSADYTQ